MMIGATLCYFLVLLTSQGSAFESELWPGEGRPVFAAKTTHLELRRSPSTASPIVTELGLKKGTKITYNLTRYRTVRPSRVTAKRAGILHGRKLGNLSYLSVDEYYGSESEWEELRYKGGDSFEYLQYRAEGSCFIKWEDGVFEVDGCPWLSDTGGGGFAMSSGPITEWWIRVTDKDSRPLGWLLVDENTLNFLPREF